MYLFFLGSLKDKKGHHFKQSSDSAPKSPELQFSIIFDYLPARIPCWEAMSFTGDGRP